MSLVLNMVGGGGGGDTYAFIVVTYPAGSTCTCVKGSKTLTAKDTTGTWAFQIPEAGTWTVTSTDGTDTASTTVTISTEGQSDSVSLTYALFIIQNGQIAIQPTLTGGTLTAGNDYAIFNSGGNAGRLAYLSIDVSNYSTLVIDITSGSISYSKTTTPGIGLSQNQPSINTSTAVVTPADVYQHMIADSGSLTVIPEGQYTVDISQFTGSVFVWFSVSGNSSGAGILNIENFYMR